MLQHCIIMKNVNLPNLMYIKWLLAVIVIFLVANLLQTPNHRLQLDTPQTNETTQPHVCVHTDLMNEVEEWKIQHSLRLVRELGASTIVEYFQWAYIEPQEGLYQWEHADKVVWHAQNQDVKIIARLGFVPEWARPDNTSLNYIEEEMYPEFASFVEQFVARYAGTIDHIIIWNEPNLAFEWGFQDIDPTRYVRMLEGVYERTHEANPHVTILAAAMAPTLEPHGSPHGLNDLLYLEAMLEAGADDYFDALAVHTYGLTNEMTDEPAPDKLNYRRVELIAEMMGQYEIEKPIYITESGWNDSPRWAHGVHPSERIEYTLDAFEWADDNWDWAETVCIWTFRYPRPMNNYRDSYTMVTPEFQLKPIYYAVQAYARGWERDEALWLPPPE